MKVRCGVLCAVFGSSAMLGACSDDKALSPTNVRQFRPVSFSSNLQGGSVSLPIPADSDLPWQGGTPWIATGLRVLRGYNVRMRMPSTMIAAHREFPPDTASCQIWNHPEGEVSPNGLENGGDYWWIGKVHYTITPDSTGTVGPSPQVHGGFRHNPDGSWVGVQYHSNESPEGGYLSMQRLPMDGVCNGHVKYDLTGSQTITIDFPYIDVQSTWPAQAGIPAQFTATATGFSPTSQWFWEWIGVDGSVPVPSCLGQSQCEYVPPGSGYMLVGVMDAELFLYFGQSANGPPCAPYQDPSLLDSTIVRRELENLLARGSAFGPQAGRTEQVTLVHKNPDGSLRLSTPPQTNTLCRSPYTFQITDATLVAVLHSHPFTAGELTPCGKNGANEEYNPDRRGGGSHDDYMTNIIWNGLRGIAKVPPFQDIVVDLDRIWAMKPLTFPDDGPSTVKKWKRVDVGCTRF